MTLKVRPDTPTRVFFARQRGMEMAEFRALRKEIVGRGKRIRTSGPCLPKAVLLASPQSFPWLNRAKRAHQCALVPARFTAEVHGLTFDPCLNFGPKLRANGERGLTRKGMEVPRG